MTIKIAGLVPIPKNGTEKANNAMEGIDCIIFAIPITILEIVLFLVISTPIGTPIAKEMNTANAVIFICSRNSCSSSPFFSINNWKNSVNDTTPFFGRTFWSELTA